MKICILSDSHDHAPLLYAAIAEAKKLGAEAILHCGDIVAPSTLAKVRDLNVPIHAIHGNNTGDLYYLSRLAKKTNNLIQYYGQDATLTLAERRIFLVHYPHYAKAMALTGDYDLVCCGHNHIVSVESIKNIKGTNTIVCNPGSVGGVGTTPTYIFADLETMNFKTITVST